MKWERFGRLNTKRLNKILEEDGVLYSMKRIFPFMTTLNVNMSPKLTLDNFKNMCKKYRYCYRLYPSCIAELKPRGFHAVYDEYPQIDNNLYVFSNINVYDIEDGDCELVYDRDAVIRVTETNDFESDSSIINDVLEQLKLRKISATDIKNLENYIYSIKFIPIKYEDIPDEYGIVIKESLFNEFKWRYHLYGQNIYKTHSNNIVEKPKATKRSKIEDTYSILKNINRYYCTDQLERDLIDYQDKFLLFEKYQEYGLESSILKLSAELKEDKGLEYWFSILNEYQTHENIFDEKLNDMKHILKNYGLLHSTYSDEYKKLFNKHNLSKWKTQQVFRKYRQEYDNLQKQANTLESMIGYIKRYTKLLKEVESNYQSDLGDNQIPNQGYGYLGDNWYDDDLDDAAAQIREEKDWEIRQEEMLLEEHESEGEYQIEISDRFVKIAELLESKFEIDTKIVYSFCEDTMSYIYKDIADWNASDYEECIFLYERYLEEQSQIEPISVTCEEPFGEIDKLYDILRAKGIKNINDEIVSKVCKTSLKSIETNNDNWRELEYYKEIEEDDEIPFP